MALFVLFVPCWCFVCLFVVCGSWWSCLLFCWLVVCWQDDEGVVGLLFAGLFDGFFVGWLLAGRDCFIMFVSLFVCWSFHCLLLFCVGRFHCLMVVVLLFVWWLISMLVDVCFVYFLCCLVRVLFVGRVMQGLLVCCLLSFVLVCWFVCSSVCRFVDLLNVVLCVVLCVLLLVCCLLLCLSSF